MRIIRAFRRRRAVLRFTPALYAEIFEQLTARGANRTEAGAFLLSPRRGNGRTVTSLAYFDDLDASCLVGGIHLSGEAFPRLWDLCDERGLRVVGDIHTHPGDGVRQSSIDADNPIVARRGHVALIAPNLGRGPNRPSALGVHEYEGDGWKSAFGDDAARLVYVGRWA